MHEILTVQLGQASNYVATHFWNAQESYFTFGAQEESLVDHDVHWRPGLGADGSETFMPRTVIYDLKGGFGSLRKINALYEAKEDGPPMGLWNGRPVVHQQAAIRPSAYQESLDAGSEPPRLTSSAVRYWSDFNRVYYHPRSIIQLNEYEVNSSLVPFERWETGDDLFASLDKEHDLIDRDLRPFVEEADQMQGVQVIATFDDAWGGFASQYAERLRDEYGKSTVWVWGLQGSSAGGGRDNRLLRLTNNARTLTAVYRHASLIIPVALPRLALSRVAVDTSSQWHVSALMATALETASLPSRLRDNSNRNSIGGMADLLNTMGKQSVATLQMSAPEAPTTTPPADSGQQQHGSLRPREEGAQVELAHLDLDFSPPDDTDSARRHQNGFAEPRVFGQLTIQRSSWDERSDDDGDDRFERRNSGPVTRRFQSRLLFPQPDSFPRIFRDDRGRELDGQSVQVTASLTTDSSSSKRLKGLRMRVTRSIAIEDREALSNDLAEMADEYHEGWSSGSDEGEDE